MPGADNVSKLSIIIPTLNEERHVGDLLSDVASQSRMPDEVIVVDAGSVDDTAAVVRRFPLVRLLEGESPVACGRNLGGRSASGDVPPARAISRKLSHGVRAAPPRHRLSAIRPISLHADDKGLPRALQPPHQSVPENPPIGRGALRRGQERCLPGEPGLRSRPQVRRHRADPAPLERAPLRHSGRAGLRLRPALQGPGHPAHDPEVRAHGAHFRLREVRLGQPHRIRVRRPRAWKEER